MFLWSRHVYGPVRSRRLGVSLGVNLLPLGRKVCTYDCPYCECGFTRDGPTLENLSTTMPSEAQVLLELRLALEAQPASEPVDTITFAGNGEPTLHPRIEAILGRALELRDELAPAARVSVLTNGIRLREKGVREAVLRADDVEVKLDAGTEQTFRQVAAPTVPWSLADLRELLVDLGKRASVQSCLFAGSLDNTGADDLAGMVGIISDARPRRLLAYTIDRAPADANLQPAPRAALETLVARARGVGVPAELY